MLLKGGAAWGAPLERGEEVGVLELEDVRSGFAGGLAHGGLMMKVGDQRVVSLMHWKDGCAIRLKTTI